MRNYLKEIDFFKEKEIVLNGKLDADKFVIVVGHVEFGEMMSITSKRDNIHSIASGGFDARFSEFKVKRLDTDSAFCIMEIKTFNDIVVNTKRAVVQGASQLNLAIELR